MTFFIALTAVLVIVCLVVRDQTEHKLGRMRTHLLGLRSEEQRLDEMHKEVEQMVRWVGEGLSRADNSQRQAEREIRELAAILSQQGFDMELDAEATEGEDSVTTAAQ